MDGAAKTSPHHRPAPPIKFRTATAPPRPKSSFTGHSFTTFLVEFYKGKSMEFILLFGKCVTLRNIHLFVRKVWKLWFMLCCLIQRQRENWVKHEKIGISNYQFSDFVKIWGTYIFNVHFLGFFCQKKTIFHRKIPIQIPHILIIFRRL